MAALPPNSSEFMGILWKLLKSVCAKIILSVLVRERKEKGFALTVQKYVMIEEGEFVIITAPNFFQGVKSAVYLKQCKIHEGGHECYLTSKTITTKLVCVQPDQPGNSMVRLVDLARIDTPL